jgi:hypothetical protein
MMKTVRVLSSAGRTSDQIVVSEDKLFLFSSGELGENATASPYVKEVEEGAEQTTFSLITNVTSRVRKTYNGTGTASIWWTRSPEATSNMGFRYVGNNGGIVTGDGGRGYYISFGFCI